MSDGSNLTTASICSQRLHPCSDLVFPQLAHNHNLPGGWDTSSTSSKHLPSLKYARADKSVSRLLWMEQVSDYWKHHRLHGVTLQLDLEIWRRLLVFLIGENSPALKS